MRTRRTTSTDRLGFTIPELIAVIAIGGIMLAIAIPNMTSIVRDTRLQVGVNAVNAAVAAARAFATRNVQDLGATQPTPIVPDAVFSGSAALFTAAGEIRLVENDQTAQDGSNRWLEEDDPGNSNPVRNGYRDIPARDYVRLPKGVGMVGIAREGFGAATFHTPPFAIRFDENGHLIAGENPTSSADRLVFYDRNYDGTYAVSSARTGSYDVDEWDPDSIQWDPTNWNDTQQLYELGFARMEAVIGVIVYSKTEFWNAGGDWPGTPPAGFATIDDWLAKHGEVILFNRYTGSAIRP